MVAIFGALGDDCFRSALSPSFPTPRKVLLTVRVPRHHAPWLSQIIGCSTVAA
jgi:hypothetical protein